MDKETREKTHVLVCKHCEHSWTTTSIHERDEILLTSAIFECPRCHRCIAKVFSFHVDLTELNRQKAKALETREALRPTFQSVGECADLIAELLRKKDINEYLLSKGMSLWNLCCAYWQEDPWFDPNCLLAEIYFDHLDAVAALLETRGFYCLEVVLGIDRRWALSYKMPFLAKDEEHG